MKEADANVRDAINRGLMPGPRLYVATRVIASTAAYEPRTENHIGGTCLPAGCDAADGPDELRKAVRRRIGHGADIIKFYADYRRRLMRFPPKQQHPYIPSMQFQPTDPNPDYKVFSDEEMRTIVEEAQLAECPVSAHAHTQAGVIAACRAGATTIEHGTRAGEAGLQAMKEYGVIMVPTLSVSERLHAHRIDDILKQVKRAHELGIRLACGGDTGTFSHGDNAREMELMVKAGVPVEDVIEACTVGGWEACGGDRCGRRFGWFEEGCSGDIVGLETDPREDGGAFRKVSFVMKDGVVWKEGGSAVPARFGV
jgi:imidazolonepropionase-like amidohydrolase